MKKKDNFRLMKTNPKQTQFKPKQTQFPKNQNDDLSMEFYYRNLTFELIRYLPGRIWFFPHSLFPSETILLEFDRKFFYFDNFNTVYHVFFIKDLAINNSRRVINCVKNSGYDSLLPHNIGNVS